MKINDFVLLPIILIITSCSGMQRLYSIKSYKRTLASSIQKDTTLSKVIAKVDKQGKKTKILSAFFGLDDALPRPASAVICDGANYKDGMPVIFSHEIDVNSMQAGDFEVTTASGKTGYVHCVTLAPADDKGELRTVLLVGHYGSIEDQPVSVKIVGNLLSLDKSVNFKGESITPIKLEVGPTIILAEVIPKDKQELGKKATQLPFGGGNGCPIGSKQVINVTWVGGITKPGGKPANDKERELYKVTLVNKDGKSTEVTPFALADLKDGDNNHRLCLNVEGTAKSVFFPAGHLTDPREDLNPDTKIEISQ
ncbi:MAG: hypothetical protein AAF518_10015 [Spirochaetota bacterium]